MKFEGWKFFGADGDEIEPTPEEVATLLRDINLKTSGFGTMWEGFGWTEWEPGVWIKAEETEGACEAREMLRSKS